MGWRRRGRESFWCAARKGIAFPNRDGSLENSVNENMGD
jgi:hypothetical protein